jgi:topoisomerase-4 subunit A
MIKGVKERKTMSMDLDMVIDVKGWKAMGNKLTPHSVKKVSLINGDAKLQNGEDKVPVPLQNDTVKEIEAAVANDDVKVSEDKPLPSVDNKVAGAVEQPKPVAPAKPVVPAKTETPPKRETTKGKDKEGGYGIGDTIDLF